MLLWCKTIELLSIAYDYTNNKCISRIFNKLYISINIKLKSIEAFTLVISQQYRIYPLPEYLSNQTELQFPLAFFLWKFF